MKNKEVTAMLMAMAFSAATMTACGAYGSMESSAYGSAEGYEMTSEQEEELRREEEAMYDWEYEMPQADLYDGAEVSQLAFGNFTFNIPDTMTEEETDDEDTRSFLIEESDSDFARLTMKRELVETEPYDENDDSFPWEKVLWQKQDALMMDERIMYMEQIMIDSQDDTMIVLHDTVNGVNVAYYYALLVTSYDDTHVEVVTLCLAATEGCSYNYRESFSRLLEGAAFVSE